MKLCAANRRQTCRESILVVKPLAFVLVICFFLCKTVWADNYDDMRTLWVTMQVGANNNMNDPDIAASVTSAANSATSNWQSMNTSPGASYLWSDLTDFTSSANIDSNFDRLQAMAAAYAQPGNPLQGNASLAQAVAYGLDWLYTNYYNPNTTMFDNWWDWEIGDAQAFMTAALLIYPQLTPAEIANYTAAIDHFDPNPSYLLSTSGAPQLATGANLTDICVAVILRGVLGKDSSHTSLTDHHPGWAVFDESEQVLLLAD